jgi:peptide/nickel transport system permease protein
MNEYVTVAKRNIDWMIIVGSLILILFFVCMLMSWIWLPHDPTDIHLTDRFSEAGDKYLLGADHLGRDILSRLLAGTKWTLGCAIFIMLISVCVGVFVGMISGLVGGKIDAFFMRMVDMILSFPEVLIALVFTGILGSGIFNICVAIMMVKWIYYARMVRTIVMNEKNKEYILYARVIGTNIFKIVLFHLLPRLKRQVIALATVDIGKVILMISAFSYIGLGIQPPTPEWGSMLNEGRPYFQVLPQLMFFPGICIFLVVLAFNLIGDSICERWDIKKE